jgi:hypothetical protein
MVWFAVQAWLVLLAAFAAGVGLSWLLLVLPAQRRLRAAAARRPPAPDPGALATVPAGAPLAAPVAAPMTAPMTAAPAAPGRTDAAETVRLPAVDSALSTLDHRRGWPGVAGGGPGPVPGAFPRSARPLPDGSAPTPQHTVKGSARSMLYHTPGSPHYGRTIAEVWFTCAQDAEAAGFADVRSRSG